MRRQHSTNLVIIILSIITSQRDNYILLFKDFMLIIKKQTLLVTALTCRTVSYCFLPLASPPLAPWQLALLFIYNTPFCYGTARDTRYARRVAFLSLFDIARQIVYPPRLPLYRFSAAAFLSSSPAILLSLHDSRTQLSILRIRCLFIQRSHVIHRSRDTFAPSSPLYTTIQLFSLLYCSTVTVYGISSCAPSRSLSSQFTASIYSLCFSQYNRNPARPITLYYSLSIALVQPQHSPKQS